MTRRHRPPYRALPPALHRPTTCRRPATATSLLDLPPAWVRPALEQAELHFVARVVRDGGIGPWRAQAVRRFAAARQPPGAGPSRTETAALVVALADLPVRDGVWRLVEEDRDPRWRGLWRHLAGHALPPYRAEPLFLLAWTAWRLGDLPAARRALDAARAEDPLHGAAAMLAELLAAGVRPGELPSLAERRPEPATVPGGLR